MFLRRRERVVRKVDVFEICAHSQIEVFYLRDFGAAEAVTPLVQSLRTVADGQLRGLARGNLDRGFRGVVFVAEWGRVAVNDKSQVVVDRLTGRELQFEDDVLFLVACIAKAVDTGETNFVSAVPEQTFLAVFEIEVNVDPAAFERQFGRQFFGPGLLDGLTVFEDVLLLGDLRDERSGRWSLVLRSAPGRSDFVG